jgi:hypothetical protein
MWRLMPFVRCSIHLGYAALQPAIMRRSKKGVVLNDCYNTPFGRGVRLVGLSGFIYSGGVRRNP